MFSMIPSQRDEARASCIAPSICFSSLRWRSRPSEESFSMSPEGTFWRTCEFSGSKMEMEVELDLLERLAHAEIGLLGAVDTVSAFETKEEGREAEEVEEAEEEDSELVRCLNRSP